MRILLAGLLTLAAFSALAPNASAVYICGHQNDASDLVIGDDPLWRTHCTTENVISHECEATVTVTTTGVTYPARCDPLIDPCNPCCYAYCQPPMTTAAAAPAPCATDTNPTDDNGVSASCTAAKTTCWVAALWFGPWLESPPAAGGCSTELWPPYDCVQDCDGPPTE